MEALIKPPALRPGDTIAAITLSWGGAGMFPARYTVGQQRLESKFGLKVIPTRHALRHSSWIAENPQARADDWMEAFENPAIQGILSMIG
ncbi:MAG TPA: LD-carboxypeptidase, partial [Opitutales bacterium]|nr:LD-carboxypeptidase [Opitutales bacterium]